MIKLHRGDSLKILRRLPDESVQCCVTSPPYWGLRNYGVAGQLGLEPTPEAYLARMVEVFREVRRVLRDDGVCFINMGDSYASARSVVSCDTSCKAPEDSRDRDCLCESLCGACRKAYQTGKAHIARKRVPKQVASPCEPNRERKESQNGHSPTLDSSRRANRNGVASKDLEPRRQRAAEQLHVSPQSNSGGSSRQSQGVYSRKDRLSSCLLCGRSIERESRECGHTTASLCERQKSLLSTQDLAANKNGKASTGDASGCRNAGMACDCSYPYYGTTSHHVTLKPKDLVGIPWRLAFALQADGWYLRSDIIWHKPNPMPESVTDRPTKSHEYVFLLTKSPRYFWDQEAVREPQCKSTLERFAPGQAPRRAGPKMKIADPKENRANASFCSASRTAILESGRNIRSVWTITPKPFRGAHFATFPPELVNRCIKAGTSQRGACPRCGKAWKRVVETHKEDAGCWSKNGGAKRADAPGAAVSKSSVFRTGLVNVPTTLGFRPACRCRAAKPVPCVVLDPFIGSGTVAAVARSLGRDCIGIDLNPKYLTMARARIKAQPRVALAV
jgi:DNA modification methylase